MEVRLGLHPASGNDWLFPGLNTNLNPINSGTFSPSIYPSQCLFDNYHRRLQQQLDIPELISRGVFLDRSDPHVEKQGRVCMLGVNVTLSPAFIRRNQQHQHWYSVLQYKDPTTEALSVNHGLGVYPQSDLQQRHIKRKQFMDQLLLRRLSDHYSVSQIDQVADVGSLASMATQLGAIYLSREEQMDLDHSQNHASPCKHANTNNLGATKSVKAQGIRPSIVKPRARTTQNLLKKTKVATMLKSHSLPPQLVRRHKDFSSKEPHTDQASNTDLTPPLSVSPNGEQVPEGLLSLQPLVRSRSLSIFKLSQSDPEERGGGGWGWVFSQGIPSPCSA